MGRGMSKEEHLPYLDGWRGLAILMVLLSHFWDVPGIDLGRFGVDLFFVLSGLLMSKILFIDEMPIGRFYRRRFARIFPVLWLFVFILVPLYDHAGHPTPVKEVVGVLTFTRTYMTPWIWHPGGAPLANTWSLNVEEHCYLILAILASLAFVKRWRAPILITLGVCTWLAILVHMALSPPPDRQYLLNTECASTGLFLSAGYRLVCDRITVPAWLAPAALLAGALCYLDSAGMLVHLVLAPMLLAFSVNHIGAASTAVVRLFSMAWLRRLGIISYSIYLWQQPLYDHQAHFPPHMAVIPAVLVGAASFYLFESPVRRWLNANWGTEAPGGPHVDTSAA